MRTNELVSHLRRVRTPQTASQVAFAFAIRYDTAKAWLDLLVNEGKVQRITRSGETAYTAPSR